MIKENAMEYAGSLEIELKEMDKLLSDDESVEIPGTTTSRCSVVLTIICC